MRLLQNGRTSGPEGLPATIPDGSVYVVEGSGGENNDFRLSARYLVLPDGRQIDLSPNDARTPSSIVGHPRRRHPHSAQPRSRVPGRPGNSQKKLSTKVKKLREARNH